MWRRFHTLGVSAPMIQNLKNLNIVQPTEIQKLALPLIHSRRDAVIAAETGSGKSLTYLLPLLDKQPTPKLSGLILVPSHLLAMQLHQVISSLHPEMASQTVTLSCSQHTMRSDASLVIATPRRIVQDLDPSTLRRVETLVLDEADMLLIGDYFKDVKRILGTLRPPTETTPQVILVAATLPNAGRKSIQNWIQYRFPEIETVHTSNLHRPVQALSHQFVPVPLEAKRDKLISDALGSTLIFVNRSADAASLAEYLASQNIPVLALHRNIPAMERHHRIQTFQSQRGILVCTDIAARGLDLPDVTHVIQYDLASDVASFLHRIGRTARASATGTATSLVSEENRLLQSSIEQALADGDTMDRVFSRRRSLRRQFRKSRENDTTVTSTGYL